MGGHRDAAVEALAARLAVHARAQRHDVAEQIRLALRAAGFVGDHLDAGTLVGQLPAGMGGSGGGFAADAILTDAAYGVLVDAAGNVLVDGSAGADGGGGGGTTGAVTGAHEEAAPAAGATAVTLAHAPAVVLAAARNGVVQSAAAGHYTLAGATLTFSTAFAAGDRVVVAYLYAP